jgi:uncharacterized protein with PIN domain
MNFSAQGYAELTRLLKADVAVLEGGYAIEGALPYVNVGIILAMAGLDYGKVVEPDYDAEKIRQSAGVMDWIKRTGDQVLANWSGREKAKAERVVKNQLESRTRNIYYDTDNIGEQQVETIHACPDCSGVLKIDSTSSRGNHILGVHIPIDACPECAEMGYQWFDAADPAEYDQFFLQDRPKDAYLAGPSK